MLLREQRLLRVYLGLLICVVATLYLWVRSQHDEPGASSGDLGPRWVPALSDIGTQRALDQQSLLGFKVAAADRALVDQLREFHQFEAGLPEKRDPAVYGEKSRLYRMKVEEYAEQYGMPRYLQLGLHLRSQFAQALQSLGTGGAAAAPARDGKLKDLAVEGVLIALSGNFLKWSRDIGLLKPGEPLAAVNLFLVETLFKMRWLRWAERVSPPEAHITRFEKSGVLAFQIERYQGITLERRLELIKELSEILPEYPADQRHVEALIRSGGFREAREYLSSRLSESPDSSQLLDLERRLFGDARE